MEQAKKTPIILVLLAWLFVGIPWGWGISEQWKNARKLFQAPPPAAAQAAPAPTAAQPAPATDKK